MRVKSTRNVMITRLVLLLALSLPALAQVTYSVVIPTTPPGGVGGACNSRSIAYLSPTGAGTAQLVVCGGNNVWTAVATSGGGIGGLTPGNIPVASSSSAIGNSNLTQNGDGTLTPQTTMASAVPSNPTFNAAGTTTCNLALSDTCAPGTMTGNSTLVANNPHGGTSYKFIFTQDATGSRSLTYPAAFQNVCQPSTTALVTTTIIVDYNALTGNFTPINCPSTDTPPSNTEILFIDGSRVNGDSGLTYIKAFGLLSAPVMSASLFGNSAGEVFFAPEGQTDVGAGVDILTTAGCTAGDKCVLEVSYSALADSTSKFYSINYDFTPWSQASGNYTPVWGFRVTGNDSDTDVITNSVFALHNDVTNTDTMSFNQSNIMSLSASTFVLGGHTCSIVATVLTCP